MLSNLLQPAASFYFIFVSSDGIEPYFSSWLNEVLGFDRRLSGEEVVVMTLMLKLIKVSIDFALN